ncbi:MAG: DUF61 family protein [Euryarchaeota archaeon]|nr:DUF61 family protein [Euryarchaeota archaeon]
MFSDGALEKLIATMNRHIPSARRRLSDLLEDANPVYLGRDGAVYRISREELFRISSLLDDHEKRRLRLPILLMTDTSYPGGAWKVSGQLEVKVISKVVGREPESEGELRLFYPHLLELRRLLPTATTCLYMP